MAVISTGMTRPVSSVRKVNKRGGRFQSFSHVGLLSCILFQCSKHKKVLHLIKSNILTFRHIDSKYINVGRLFQI